MYGRATGCSEEVVNVLELVRKQALQARIPFSRHLYPCLNHKILDVAVFMPFGYLCPLGTTPVVLFNHPVKSAINPGAISHNVIYGQALNPFDFSSLNSLIWPPGCIEPEDYIPDD